MSSIPVKDSDEVVRKVDTLSRVDGSDTVETQVVAVGSGINSHILEINADGSVNVRIPAGLATETTLQSLLSALGGTLAVEGTVNVSNFPSTQEVVVNSLPLPIGAATEVTLTDGTQKTQLVEGANALSIDSGGRIGVNVNGNVAVTGSFWQATQPVSLATLPALAAGANTIGNVNVNGTIPVSGPLTDTQLRATAVPVAGTFWQATQPVSAASLPLPAGAATEATLTSLSGKIPAVGVKTGAGSLPVVLALDQAALTVTVSNFPATQAVSLASAPLPAGAATDSKLQLIIDSLATLLVELQSKVEPTDTLAVSMASAPSGASTDAKLDELKASIDALLTDAELRASAVPVINTDTAFTDRLAFKALARLTNSTAGLRVDASGATITANIAASQTLATVTTVGTVNAANAVALGRTTTDGQGIQLSNMAFSEGFRRNLVRS